MLLSFLLHLVCFSLSANSQLNLQSNVNEKNQLFAKLLNNDENNQKKYTIVNVNPQKLPTSGSISIEIQINPSFNGPCFIKFDETVVKGNGDDNGVVICEAPKHKSGSSFIYFSVDSESWSEGYPIMFFMESQTLLIIVLIIGGTCLASLILFWWQMRQCKNSSRRNRDALNAYDHRLDYEDDDDFQPLNRKSNRNNL